MIRRRAVDEKKEVRKTVKRTGGIKVGEKGETEKEKGGEEGRETLKERQMEGYEGDWVTCR